jgi:hypothetical protein
MNDVLTCLSILRMPVRPSVRPTPFLLGMTTDGNRSQPKSRCDSLTRNQASNYFEQRGSGRSSALFLESKN